MNSSYDLSLEEQKIILTLASMVQPNDEEFKPYKFRIIDFMELLGVNTKTKYTEIPKITKELMKKVFEIQEENTIIQTAWISGTRYEKGSGMVTIKFNPDLKPYMLQLKEKFTQYQLANVLSMKSKYSPRIYEILKCNEFKKQKYIELEVEELRRLLKTEDVYPKYNDFKRFVLERTQKELKKLTDIDFDFEEIKIGRKVTSIKFNITSTKNKNNCKDEIAVALEESKQDLKLVKQVKTIFKVHNLTDHEARCILKDANSNIDLIQQCHTYSLDKDIKNIVGYIRELVKGFNKPKGNIKKGSFNDYEQRIYDFDDLEKKLLGWDNNA